eukprot:2437654-Rhodomonas_salina.4
MDHARSGGSAAGAGRDQRGVQRGARAAAASAGAEGGGRGADQTHARRAQGCGSAQVTGGSVRR